MTRALVPDHPEDGEQPGRLPSELAELMWPELPGIVTETVEEIRRIPEYDRPPESAYDQVVRLGVEKLVRAFVEHVADPAMPVAERDGIARTLGYFEAVEGRTLDALHAAYRVGLQVAWNHIGLVAQREGFDAQLVTTMGQAMNTYLDEITSQSVHGHRQALANADAQIREIRLKLVRAIVSPPEPMTAALAKLAEDAEWVLPGKVTPVAVQPGVAATRAALHHDVLADLDGPQPVLLFPGPADKERLEMLTGVFGAEPSVIGLTVPLGLAADSFRWARRILELTEDGIIEESPQLLCEDHLITIWLLSDPALADQLARLHLAPLTGMPAPQRRKLTETLRAWVSSRGSAVEIAEHLQVHPQTVRYRIRQLDAYLGEMLEDSDTRFSVEVAMRATWLHLRKRTEKPSDDKAGATTVEPSRTTAPPIG